MKRWFFLFTLTIGAVALAAFPTLSGVELASGQPTTIKVPAGRKALVIAFLSSKCPCSRSHEAVLRELATAHPEAVFVGVHANADEPVEQAEAHFRGAKLPFAVLQDEHSALANQYSALKTPHIFVINQEGETVFRGGVDDSRHPENAHKHFLADALTAVAAGRRPEVTEARALGCVIAR